MEEVLVVTPSPETLLKQTSSVKCPEKDCPSVLMSGSHLTMHLAKTHKMEHLLKKDDPKKHFHCPEITCSYNSKLHFRQFKLLKQHYVKVHSEKSRKCQKCEQGFSTEIALKHHREYCGAIFKCGDCDTSYRCYESLQTHCRRKKHLLIDKTAYKEESCNEEGLTSSKSESAVCLKNKIPLPRRSNTFVLILTQLKSNSNKAVQTELKNSFKRRKCVETQTIGDFIPIKQINEYPKTNTETQTKQVASETKSCNTSEKLNLEDYAYGDGAAVQKNSSTQTSVIRNEMCTQVLMDFDTTLFNCNSETQTELFGDSLLNNCDFYSNMYTQTPSEMLLDGLEFSDTYTQTAFDDVVRSVESQTMLYNDKRSFMCRDVANIETQTDVDLKQMLDEIV